MSLMSTLPIPLPPAAPMVMMQSQPQAIDGVLSTGHSHQNLFKKISKDVIPENTYNNQTSVVWKFVNNMPRVKLMVDEDEDEDEEDFVKIRG
ncbi:hypothetical protein L6452_14938 [Arctium lappa]|uniref:Uncharacterized protein n=1 Tax=Arctium lappa TaxID=4217 RepID=A0ACB9CMH9_ARCLA|nr:hypothetical protein L6452_14938 [Arctium lappa]